MAKLGNIFILGDSYSTFEGYVPEGYGCFYSTVPKDTTDVTKVEQTWWYRIVSDNEGTVVMNNSWSGTTVCNTGYGGYCPDTSFIGRFDRLVETGFFRENKIDTFFILGGTNDSWANSPIGNLKYGDWTDEDLREALPAFCYLLDRVKKCVPNARIVNILNNTAIKEELAEGYSEACAHMGIECAAVGDIEMMGGHPTIRGMEQIEECITTLFDR